MRQSSSADTLSAVAAGRLTRWPAFPYGVWVRLSLWLSVTVVAVLFGWGAWQRRWIADDGLHLDACSGNQLRCADLLGINRNTLRKKVSDLNIEVTRRRRLM